MVPPGSGGGFGGRCVGGRSRRLRARPGYSASRFSDRAVSGRSRRFLRFPALYELHPVERGAGAPALLEEWRSQGSRLKRPSGALSSRVVAVALAVLSGLFHWLALPIERRALDRCRVCLSYGTTITPIRISRRDPGHESAGGKMTPGEITAVRPSPGSGRWAAGKVG
jgi:hypothetical protein